MTLQELVQYKTDLVKIIAQLSLDQHVSEDRAILSSINLLHSDKSYSLEIDSVIKSYSIISNQHESIVTNLNDIIAKIDVDIDNLADEKFNSPTYSQKFSEHALNYSDDYISDLQTADSIVTDRIIRYCDWHYPGLVIGARPNQPIDAMTACDPLYITTPVVKVELDPSLTVLDLPEYKANVTEPWSAQYEYANFRLGKLVKDYSQQYQRRVRLYPVDDANFYKLPRGQFGFIFAWDYFNWINLTNVTVYLNNIYHLLRPGGVLMFSYNNCDLLDSARVADDEIMSYASATKLKTIAESIGYEIVVFEDHQIRNGHFNYISWAELKRPGQLITVKSHQAVGKIIEK